MQNPGVISRNQPQSVKISPNTLQFDTIRKHLVMNLTWTQDWYRDHVAEEAREEMKQIIESVYQMKRETGD